MHLRTISPTFSHTFSFTPADRLIPRGRTQFVPLSDISTGSGATFLSHKVAPATFNNVQGPTVQLETRVLIYYQRHSHTCVFRKKRLLFILCMSSLSSLSVGKDVNVQRSSRVFFFLYIYIRTSLCPTGSLSAPGSASRVPAVLLLCDFSLLLGFFFLIQ